MTRRGKGPPHTGQPALRLMPALTHTTRRNTLGSRPGSSRETNTTSSGRSSSSGSGSRLPKRRRNRSKTGNARELSSRRIMTSGRRGRGSGRSMRGRVIRRLASSMKNSGSGSKMSSRSNSGGKRLTDNRRKSGNKPRTTAKSNMRRIKATHTRNIPGRIIKIPVNTSSGSRSVRRRILTRGGMRSSVKRKPSKKRKNKVRATKTGKQAMVLSSLSLWRSFFCLGTP